MKKKIQPIKQGEDLVRIGLYVEAQNPEAIKEVHAAISTILTSGQDQATKQLALSTLDSLCKVGDRNISHCQVNMGGEK